MTQTSVTTIIRNIKYDDFSIRPRGAKSYYSSAWTGIMSIEELAEITLDKAVKGLMKDNQSKVEKEIEHMILYGFSKPEVLR